MQSSVEGALAEAFQDAWAVAAAVLLSAVVVSLDGVVSRVVGVLH